MNNNQLREVLDAIHVAEEDLEYSSSTIGVCLENAESCRRFGSALTRWDPTVSKMVPVTEEDRDSASINAEVWADGAVDATYRAYRSWRKLRAECQKLLDLTKD